LDFLNISFHSANPFDSLPTPRFNFITSLATSYAASSLFINDLLNISEEFAASCKYSEYWFTFSKSNPSFYSSAIADI
jgi:hypothetical protein